MAEGNVAINPDSGSTGAHNIRTVKTSPVGSPQTAEEQQVVSLGSGDTGDLVQIVSGGAAKTNDQITQALLLAMILRLDLLNAALIDRYTPPDSFGI